jgi:outer membrane protein assembly factor BamB
VLWRQKIAGGFAGPAVANGRVYVHDYLTDADFRKVTSPSARPKLQGKERVLCFDAVKGDLIWKHEYDQPYAISYPAGPRCTPTVHEGKVYTLGAEGRLFCLDAAKGTPLWDKDLKTIYQFETSIWGFCGHPLIDGQRLFLVAGGKGSVAVAFDKDTGKELWKALTAKEPGYAPPTLIEAGGKKQLLIWHADGIDSLDPETGKSYWFTPLVPSYGMSIMAPRKHGDYLFAGGIGGKCVVLKLDDKKPAATEVWQGEKGIGVYPVNSTPIIDKGIIYGVDVTGTLRAVELTTGKILWEQAEPVSGPKKQNSGTAFLVKNGDRTFLFNEQGELIIARLRPEKYEEIDRWKMLEPTGTAFGRDVVWSHPAFANRCAFARNDKEIVCVSLAEK